MAIIMITMTPMTMMHAVVMMATMMTMTMVMSVTMMVKMYTFDFVPKGIRQWCTPHIYPQKIRYIPETSHSGKQQLWQTWAGVGKLRLANQFYVAHHHVIKSYNNFGTKFQMEVRYLM